MTYNIRHAKGRDRRVAIERICRVIEEARPDVVALQEVDCGLTRSRWIDQGQTIADWLQMCHTAGHNWFVEEGAYGNAILSRWPATLLSNVDLSVSGREPRGCLLAKVHPDGGDFVVGSVHFGLGMHERRRQRDIVLRHLEELCSDEPILLMGDFNAPPCSTTSRRFREDYADVFEAAGTGLRSTYRRWGLSLCLDYIYVTETLLPLTASVLRTETSRVASDHFPVVARLLRGTVGSRHASRAPAEVALDVSGSTR